MSTLFLTAAGLLQPPSHYGRHPHTPNMNHHETNHPMTNAEADCLCFAVRYALARPTTTAPLTVALEVVRVWDRLQLWQRKQMYGEILATEDRPQIWRRVLDLEVELPTE